MTNVFNFLQLPAGARPAATEWRLSSAFNLNAVKPTGGVRERARSEDAEHKSVQRRDQRSQRNAYIAAAIVVKKRWECWPHVSDKHTAFVKIKPDAADEAKPDLDDDAFFFPSGYGPKKHTEWRKQWRRGKCVCTFVSTTAAAKSKCKNGKAKSEQPKSGTPRRFYWLQQGTDMFCVPPEQVWRAPKRVRS